MCNLACLRIYQRFAFLFSVTLSTIPILDLITFPPQIRISITQLQLFIGNLKFWIWCRPPQWCKLKFSFRQNPLSGFLSLTWKAWAQKWNRSHLLRGGSLKSCMKKEIRTNIVIQKSSVFLYLKTKTNKTTRIPKLYFHRKTSILKETFHFFYIFGHDMLKLTTARF